MTLAILAGGGCATTKRDDGMVRLIDGGHVKAWPRAEALAVPAISNQAARAEATVYVVSDNGLRIMYGLRVRTEDGRRKTE